MRTFVTVVATEQITLSGTQTIDGVAVVAGDTVLSTAFDSPKRNNGLYAVKTGAWRKLGTPREVAAIGGSDIWNQFTPETYTRLY